MAPPRWSSTTPTAGRSSRSAATAPTTCSGRVSMIPLPAAADEPVFFMGRVCDVAGKAFRRGDRIDVMSRHGGLAARPRPPRARRSRGRPHHRRGTRQPIRSEWPHERPAEGPHLVEAVRAEEVLRRRHHRRRRARHGDRLLPGEDARHQERRRAREELHRRRRHRPQHDHHPLELPHARGHPLLRALDGAVPRPLAGARHQHDAVDARALHARPHRLVGARAARARRDQPAARRQLAADRPRGDRRALPRAEHVDRRRLSRSRRRSTTRRAPRCATTPSSGATPRAPTTRACTCTRASR